MTRCPRCRHKMMVRGRLAMCDECDILFDLKSRKYTPTWYVTALFLILLATIVFSVMTP